MMRYRVGLDIGGTFTDIVVLDTVENTMEAYKVLTNPRDPAQSFIDALDRLGIDYKLIDIIIHATTLGTNMFLGQAGIEPPEAILITNRGFRDVIEIGRQNRAELYNLFFTKPRPLIPRENRVGVSGRIDAEGNELEPINPEEIEQIIMDNCEKIKLYIVSLLHSYVNPSHEILIKEIIESKCPDAVVVTSHEVDPKPREYERTATTIINGLLIPILSRYLDRIRRKLGERGYGGSILVMRSSGGVSSVDYALKYPASFIESGPAAGAVATAFIAKQMGVDYALGFDMGGTTAKASSIIRGTPLITGEYEVGGSIHMGRVVKGSGYPLRIPHIDLAEVSSGGGTIAWVDEGGALRVGPISAGADPGPACYGRGGVEPTITDAHLVLGRLPDSLGDGEVMLDKRAAHNAIRKVSDRLGMDIEETAIRIIELANQHMSRAIRLVTVERGLDPTAFTLFAFGGAGPLHAADLMDIGIKETIIPSHPGVFSALGLLYTDYKYDFATAIAKYDSEVSQSQVDNVFSELERRAYKRLEMDGLAKGEIKILRYLEMRYWGQAYELSIPYNGSLNMAIESFHELHMARYGYKMEDEKIFIESARIEVYKIIEKPSLEISRAKPCRPRPKDYREVYFGDEGWIRTRVYSWRRLRPGGVIDGPALIMMRTSTVLIPSDYRAEIDTIYSIHLGRGD